ncbi:MAG TPA: TetR/AcrR family transcriptional regulator [Solirubrobacteraceae bacterium]|nr:TetR/AcrR family transcriptional regulator [Solirubrobacteraceae bacterium]
MFTPGAAARLEEIEAGGAGSVVAMSARRGASRNGRGRDSTRVRLAGAASPGVAPGGAGATGAVQSIGPGRMEELQRVRILGAMVHLVRERGVTNVTVAHVVERSGVSRRTFYELFDDREACFLAAFEATLARAVERLVPAYTDGEGRWRERIRAGLAALLQWLDEEPEAGALCVVDTFAGDRQVLKHRRMTVEALVDVVHEGRHEVTAGPRPARLAAEGIVGAVLSVLHARLSTSEPEPLSKLLNPLMAMVVLPYLGPAAADEELARRTSRKRPPAKRPPAPENPLRGLHMRLTYRTVRVLLAIAELSASGANPSSREVADASGIADAGQMSKLLARLEHLGLIANNALRTGRGEPNAWRLTDRGREVERAISEQAMPGVVRS